MSTLSFDLVSECAICELQGCSLLEARNHCKRAARDCSNFCNTVVGYGATLLSW